MSRYENYSIKNNVHGSLYAPISSLATTIQLKDGEGARFSTDMLATLESVDTTGKVTKREIVLITGISGDTLTVTRKYAPCPASDDGNTQGQVSFSFDADDTINAYITKEHFDRVEDGFENTNNEIDDILENGDYKLRTYARGGLQVEVKGGPVLVGSAYYEFAGDTITLTNNATNYVEIDEDGILVANTTGWSDKNTKISKVVTSGGAVTSIEDWRLGTVGGEISKVNIHDLTEKQTLSPDDEFIVSDSDNIYNNKKVKFGSFQSGLSYDSEIEAGENLSKGDIILNTEPCYSGDLVDNSIDFGDTNTKVAIKQIANGETMSSIYLYLKATNGSTATGLTFNVESDNNGEPSGTALATKEIIGDFQVLDLDGTITGTNVGNMYLNSFLLGFSEDGKKARFFDGSEISVYTFSTAYQLSTASYVSRYSASISRRATIVKDGLLLDCGNLYKITDYGYELLMSNTPSIKGNGILGDGLSRDGKYRYLISYAGGVSDWTRYLEWYELSTPYDITSTGQRLGDISMFDMSWSAQNGYISVCKDFIGISMPGNNYNFYKLTNGVPEYKNQISSVGGSNRKTVSYNGIYLYYLSSNYNYQYELGPKGLSTDLKKLTVDFTSITPTKGDTYWITLTPTGGSGDRFSLGYITKTTNNYNLATYDGSDWTDDTTKYPYAYGVANNAQFYYKASTANQGTDTKQAMIVRKNVNALGKVSYDFFGISKMLSNLLAGNSYYISSTPGQLTTASGGFKVGEALSSTDLLLTTE